MFPVTVSLEVAAGILVPLAIGLLAELIDAPYWAAGLAVTMFYVIFGIVALVGAPEPGLLLLIGRGILLLGLLVAYIVGLVSAYLGFLIGKKISADFSHEEFVLSSTALHELSRELEQREVCSQNHARSM